MKLGCRVVLSGSVRIAGDTASTLAITANLRIRGRLAGELTLRGFTLSGRVGGALAHARLGAL